MNEKIYAHKHLKKWSFNSSSRQWRFTVKHLKKPVWVNPVYAQKLRDYTITLEPKHRPGIDFINASLTHEILFDYLERKNILYDIGETRYGRTLIAFEDLREVEKLEPLLNRLFDEVDWSENWTRCDHCGVMVPTMPAYYGDTREWKLINDCEIICRDCLTGNPEWIIDDCLNSRERALPSWINPPDGFIKLFDDDLENGFHHGQNDDPEKVEIPENHDFLFQITDVGQFDVCFNVYIRNKDYEN